MFPLTETQLAVLDFIAKHICEFQRPPTMADISRRRGWSSPSTAAKCVEAHRAQGLRGTLPQEHPRQVLAAHGVLPLIVLARG